MKTIQKEIFKQVPSGEFRTIYISNDDIEWASEKEANSRNKLLSCKDIEKNWSQVNFVDESWYLVKDESEYKELLEIVQITRYVRCNGKPTQAAYPCVVRFDYGGDYPETLLYINKDDARRLHTFLQ